MPARPTETAIALDGRAEVPVSEALPADGVAPKPAVASDVGDHIDLPVGITVIFLILMSTAIVNLFTKKVATVWGIGFTLGFLTVFIVCEQLSRRLRRGERHEHLEQFNEKVTDHPTRIPAGREGGRLHAAKASGCKNGGPKATERNIPGFFGATG